VPECRNLVDDKIGAKDLPKDLQRLATKVLDSEQAVEKKLGKQLNKKVSQPLEDVRICHAQAIEEAFNYASIDQQS